MPSENLKTSGPSSVALQELLRDYAPLIEQVKQIYNATEAERWGITRAVFAEALCRSAVKRLGESVPSPAEVASYLQSLHFQDLALACGCAQGNPQAWEYFFENYREVLYAAARAIVGRPTANEAKARDLADSLYAELYGGNLSLNIPADGSRRSLFLYFHGRSKLSTWLRAVLAQRHIDSLRTGWRTQSLDTTEHSTYGVTNRTSGDGAQQAQAVRDRDNHGLARASAARFVAPDPDRERFTGLMQEALVGTLSALPPRDRLRLALYYVQDLTLAKIGHMLGEHEATVSRHLDRVRKDVRSRVEQSLREKRLSDSEIRLCFSVAQEEWPFDLANALEIDPSLPAAGARETRSAKQSQVFALRKEP